jgi:hypothetical protein
MSILLIIVILVVVFGGGGYYAHGAYGAPGLGFSVGGLLLVLLVLFLLGVI